MDWQKTALVVMGIEERELLVTVNDINSVIDVERHRDGRGRIAGAIEIDHDTHQRIKSRSAGVFSQREMVGCEHSSVPLSGNLPQASLKAGSQRRRSRSSAPPQ